MILRHIVVGLLIPMEIVRYIKSQNKIDKPFTLSPQKFYIVIDKSKQADLNTLLVEVPPTFMARFIFFWGGGYYSVFLPMFFNLLHKPNRS